MKHTAAESEARPDYAGLLKWELIGALPVFLLGALIHFVFEWSGESRLVGAFVSVNESVWEHFKQGFWPMLAYAAVEWSFLRQQVRNLLAAKAAAVFILPVLTGVAFYAYTAVMGEEILIVDISIFFVAVVIAQMVSYRILTLRPVPRFLNFVCLVAILALAAAYITFTFSPPHLPIFQDPSGSWGIG